MKVLSIDTASDICGVSILENKNLIYQLDSDTGHTHSENLMPMIKLAFEASNLKLKDIDLIVCDKGPGSFTGIRIGIATAKAFCDSYNLPGIGVTSLESLAYNIKIDGIICSIINCKNDNCYFSLFERKDNIIQTLIEPNATNISEALTTCVNIVNSKYENYPITFVGDGSIEYKEQISNHVEHCIFAEEEHNNLNSYNLALAGLYKFKNNNLDELLPLYLKKPQAQLQLEEKLKNG